jgi:hypothetical protein
VPISFGRSRNPNAGRYKYNILKEPLILTLFVFYRDANEYLSRFVGSTSGTEDMVAKLVKERLEMPIEDRPVSERIRRMPWAKLTALLE